MPDASSCEEGEKCDAPEDPAKRPLPAQSVEPQGHCAAEEIVRIERPLDVSDPSAGSFSYAYRIARGTDPSAPVVVRIPGGPGQSSSQTDRNAAELPAGATMLFTDPRGVGCNVMEGELDDDTFYDSVAFAQDILAALRNEGITDWVLYGTSYGTALGTITASMAEAEGIPPRVVVLEGTLGRTFLGEEELRGTTQEWAKIMEAVSPAVREEFATESPFGLDGAAWGVAMNTFMAMGSFPGVPDAPAQYLGLLDDPDSSGEVLDLVRSFAVPQPQEPGSERLFASVGCREIADTVYTPYVLVEGELVPESALCEDTELDRPYDAADWPLSMPIIYLQGSADTRTPMFQALAHVERQPGARRYFIELDGTGHNPLSLALVSCAPDFWEAVFAEGEGLEDMLDACVWPTTLTVHEPEPS
ncbi:MAG: alpha/beta hydrolase [Myxococcota bacterium]